MKQAKGILTKKKALTVVLLVAAVLLTAILLRGRGGTNDASTLAGRQAFLQELGWEIDPASEDLRTVQLPDTLDGMLTDYNEMQLAQGYDLSRHLGEQCQQYSYLVCNYPDDSQTVLVTLYVQGRRVIQIGCDPKADSTITLLGGELLQPVMNYLREHDEDPERIEDIAREGFGGVLCIETGGPTPGLGCAGRGIIATFNLLEDLRLFETWEPDVVLYDVLGDVVCGGFAAPIREGYAEKVLIVTSGEKMALYAADNINTAVANFEDRGYARVAGIVLNHRNVPGETDKVQAFATAHDLPIVAEISRSDDITRCEDEGKTVVEGDRGLPVSQ